MSTLSEYEKFYSKLFSVGSLRRNTTLYVFSLGMLIVITYIFSSNFLYVFSLLLVLSSILAVEYFLLKKLLTPYNFFSLRRLLAINYISIYTSTIVYLLLHLFLRNSYLAIEVFFLVIIAFKSFVYYTIIYEKHHAKTYLPVITNIALILLHQYVLGFLDILFAVFMCLLAIISILYVELIEKLSNGAVTYCNGYIRSWLLDDPAPLEDLLLKSSSRDNVTVKCLVFKGPYTFNLVFPLFHFGPFKNVGSSCMPSQLKKSTYILHGSFSAVFHTPVSHERDLTSHYDVNKVIHAIVKSSPIISGIDSISSLYMLSKNDVCVYGFTIGPYAVIILSCDDMEDIPAEIGESIKDLGIKFGFKDVIVVDAHTGLRSRISIIDRSKLEKMLMLSEELLHELRNAPQYPIIAAFTSIYFPEYDLDDGLGYGGVSLFLWRVPKQNNLIIVFDSNNVDPHYKELLVQSIRERYQGTNTIVVSDDTHEVTARSLRYERGYSVWGEKEQDRQSIHKISSMVNYLLRNTHSFYVDYHSIEIDVNILGSSLLRSFESMIRRSLKIFKLLAIAFYIPLLFVLMISLVLLKV